MDRLVRNRPSCCETRRQSLQGIRGFTLTELLVTMAIIALLLGLLLSCLGPVGIEVDAVQKGRDFQTWYSLLLMYTQDHEGSFPKVTNLAEADQQVHKALEPYLKDERLISSLSSIGWRYTISPKTSLNSVKLDQIRNPGCVPIGGEQFSDSPRKGKVLVLFADGHVGRMTQEELSKALMSPIDTGKTPAEAPFDVNVVECSQ